MKEVSHGYIIIYIYIGGKIPWVASKNKILENQLVDGQNMSKIP